MWVFLLSIEKAASHVAGNGYVVSKRLLKCKKCQKMQKCKKCKRLADKVNATFSRVSATWKRLVRQ
jgi:hypothetical protein